MYKRQTVDCFLRYCETIFKRYKGKVRHWLTFNEINCMSSTPWTAEMCIRDRHKTGMAFSSCSLLYFIYFTAFANVCFIMPIQMTVFCFSQIIETLRSLQHSGSNPMQRKRVPSRTSPGAAFAFQIGIRFQMPPTIKQANASILQNNKAISVQSSRYILSLIHI